MCSPTSARLSSWAPNADHSCILFSGPDGGPVGTARRVQLKRDALVERITEFDPPRALAYDIEGLPSRLRRVTNRWTLAASAPDSTVVTLTSTVDIGPRPPQKLAERVLCRFLGTTVRLDARRAGEPIGERPCLIAPMSSSL